MPGPTPTIFDLTPAEKLQLVEDLWDDLATDAASVTVQDWQKQELDRRKAKLHQHPGTLLTWEQVKQRVLSRHAS